MNGPAAVLVADYLRLRQGLGYHSPSQERMLRSFARYLDQAGHAGPVPLETSLAWATSTASADRRNAERRLMMVRGFLRHLAALDNATAVPTPGLLGTVSGRRPPYVYSDREISELLTAAAGLGPAGGLRARCYVTLFGLLACTGLRISEALALSCADVDLGAAVLTVRAGKRGRTRLVPLHPSTVDALTGYATDRARRYGEPEPGAAFFCTDDAEQVSYDTCNYVFRKLRHQLGWDRGTHHHAPHVHDLRHRMAVRRIQAWHAEGADVDAKLPALATYLGHTEVRHVYWYLSAAPELMAIIADRFENYAADTPGGAS
ncbi:MAG: tyrosine-type recombinase/integrase [Frankiaceae bacterium]|nr:tyrosine-type recombinase/integrase [Frankiaceae bacterium]